MPKSSPTEYYIKSFQYVTKEVEVVIPDDPDTGDEGYTYKNTMDAANWIKGALQHADPLTGSKLPTDSVQSWFKGKMGDSTTKFNPGQRCYYSPVGIGYNVSNEKEVFANFKADGNVGQTCSLDFLDSTGRSVIQNVCQAFIDNEEIQREIFSHEGDTKQFFTTVKNDLKHIDNKEGIKHINKLLTSYSEKTEIGKQIRECIQNIGSTALIEYYQKTGNAPRYCGPGFSPNESFYEAESLYRRSEPGTEAIIGKKIIASGEVDDYGKYTECVIQSTEDNLDFVFASTDTTSIPYPDLINGDWVIKKGASTEEIASVLQERLKAMIELYDVLEEVNPKLKLALIDENGTLLATSNKEDIEELLEICTNMDDNWLMNFEQKIKNDFTPVIPQPLEIEEESWETSPQHEEIKVAKELSQFGMFRPSMGLKEMYLKVPEVLQHQLDNIFKENNRAIQSGDFKDTMSRLRQLCLKYHPDKNRGEMKSGYVEITAIMDKIKDPESRKELQDEVLFILDKAESETKEDMPKP